MNPLEALEHEITGLQERLSLRPTLDLARQIGERLLRAKALLPHGEWKPWLTRCGLAYRTSTIYTQIAKVQRSSPLPEHLSIIDFLRQIRQAKRSSRDQERLEARAEARLRVGDLPDSIQIHHADCRLHQWPTLDMICTDPPWRDLDAYRHLAQIADRHLVEGGLLMVQVGTSFVGEVMRILQRRLTFLHILSITFDEKNTGQLMHPWQSNWRPVLALSKGKMRRKGMMAVSDVYTVRLRSGDRKSHHEWEQPLAPWTYWLSRLATPGQIIGDPFMGSATIGVACKANHLRYIGTEIDADHFAVARGRLLSS